MDGRDTLLLACAAVDHRSILRSIFEDGYNMLEADNAEQMKLLMKQNCGCIAAVMLDSSISGEFDRSWLQESGEGLPAGQVPFIVITEDDSPEKAAEAFRSGATDVIPIQYEPYAMQQRVRNIVELFLHKCHLEELVQEHTDTLRHTNDSIVDALSSIIEYRSLESGQHILRIRHFTKILLEEVSRSCPEYGLSKPVIGIISSASSLHDIGKISIPDAILNKAGKLTADEMDIMRSHTVTGCRILERLQDSTYVEYLRYAHNICHYHHERWDGSGYPEGLAGDDIPICAQVVGLADAYDALTTKRVYKDAIAFDAAANMILQGECGAFSPKLLECFKHVCPRFEALARDYADGLSPRSEHFDTTLPPPSDPGGENALELVQTKYLALLHDINAAVAEVDLNNNYYHLIYNPYPEFAVLHNVRSFPELAQQIAQQLILPEDQAWLKDLLYCEVPRFLREGLRKQTFRCRIRSQHGGPALFDMTLLRLRPNEPTHKKFLVLWRRADDPDKPRAGEQTYLQEGVIRCLNDSCFTMVGYPEMIVKWLGYSARELQEQFGSHLIELILPEDRDRIRQAVSRQLEKGGEAELEYRLRHKDGSILWAVSRSRLVMEPDGREYLYSTLIDTTASRKAHAALQEKMERYEIILAQTENVLFDWDLPSDTISFSDTWESIFGFKPFTQGVRKGLATGVFFHPDDLPLLLDRICALENGESYQMVEVRIAKVDGRYLWCRFRATALRDEQGVLQRICGIIINIDAEKRSEQALQNRAERDALTGMLNKQTAQSRAREYLKQYPDGVRCAILVIDLDNFKLVNDCYGHMFGDAVLSQSAQEIRKLFRAQDIIGRIGGDEFMVLMRGVENRELVESRCQRLISALHNLFRKQKHDCPVGCSIGVAMAPEDGTAYEDLFLHADQALYQAKNLGKGNYVFHDSNDPVFQTWRKMDTVIGSRIDSNEQPGLANSSLVRHVFRKLYTSSDVQTSVMEALTLVGQQMNVSRVYVFENSADGRFCSNTYEWCNTDVRPEQPNLQNLCYETDLPGFRELFDESGIFYCPDVSLLPRNIYDIVTPQNIKSMLMCAIRDNGKFSGYVGFDECSMQRLWTKEQIEVLTYFSEMLSVFLLKKQAEEEISRRIQDLTSILDNQNAWIYVIDPESWSLQFLNARTRELIPGARENQACYKALWGRESPCENCPLASGAKTEAAWSMASGILGFKLSAEATPIRWSGRDACMITCRKQ